MFSDLLRDPGCCLLVEVVPDASPLQFEAWLGCHVRSPEFRRVAKQEGRHVLTSCKPILIKPVF